MRYLKVCLFAVLLMGLASPIQAQNPTATDTSGTETVRKDPGRAVSWSVGGTLLLTPAFGAGLIVGPAFGHFYADNNVQAWRGIGTRAGALTMPLLGFAMATGEEDMDEGITVLSVMTGIGLAGILASGIYDIATADNAARRYNQIHGFQATDVQVSPTIGGPQGEQVGLSLRVTF